MRKIKYCAGYKYQLKEDYEIGTKIFPTADIVTPFICLTTGGMLTVKAGYAWDGPSGPTIDTKNFMRGSLVHDALYQLMRMRLLDCGWRPTTDEELVRICKQDGMWGLRRWWVMRGVRFGGEGSAAWQAEKILIAPAILLMLIIPPIVSAHDCCRPDGGMSALSAKTVLDVNWHEFESELAAAIDIASKKADDALACEYAKMYSDLYISSDPYRTPYYQRIKTTYRRWSDRCEELQAEAIDAAYPN